MNIKMLIVQKWKMHVIGRLNSDMLFKTVFRRLLYTPIGLCKELIKLANKGGRDIENKRRFPNSIIDSGNCFTNDVTVGHHSHIFENCIINHSHIGNYTYISRNALIQNSVIGNYCSIAHEVISGLGNHPLDLFSTSPIFYRKYNPLKITILEKESNFSDYNSITIGNDVWIGARAIILDGVNVGNGAVIAAGAVVTKDIPPYAIVAGIPAKIIRYRTNEINIRKYMDSEWWNLLPQEAYNKMI